MIIKFSKLEIRTYWSCQNVFFVIFFASKKLIITFMTLKFEDIT